MPFPDIPYDNLYKHALRLCLDNCSYVCAIVPETFARSGLFTDRLDAVVSLPVEMFSETDHPACMALFTPRHTGDVRVYVRGRRIGTLSGLNGCRPPESRNPGIVFNHPRGNVGLLGADSTSGETIRFCRPGELRGYSIRQACRYITRIMVPGRPDIDRYNELLRRFRRDAHDMLMAPIRGRRKDGKYRRRLDFGLARDLIASA